MLGRDQDALDLDRALVAVLVDLVAHRHLRLAVGPQVRQHVGLAHLGQPMGDPVRELNRQRHQLGRLVRGVAEHHPLVAGADLVDRVDVAVLDLERLVDALGDVGRLLVERDDDAAGLGVEAVLRAGVADLRHRLADEARDVDVGRRRDLARDDDEAGRDQGLARDAAVRVVREDGVEDGVRDLVGDLVGMPLGDRLRAEAERAGAHCRNGIRSAHPSVSRTARSPPADRRQRLTRSSGRAASASPRGRRAARRRARCRRPR